MKNIKKIGESEMREAGVVSLSSRPSSPYAYGGDGLSPTALKERFDRLPRLIAERLNLLLDALREMPELEDLSGGSAAEGMLTGMFPETNAEHTLAMLFRELLDGSAAAYLGVGGGRSLAEELADCRRLPRITWSSGSVLLESGCEVRAGRAEALTVSLPDEVGEGFLATLVFESPTAGMTAFEMPSEVVFSGDDTVDGHFLPKGGMHYTCVFWYDGSYQAAVRGVRCTQ